MSQVKSPHGGVEGVVEMLRVMGSEDQARLLSNLAERDPELVKTLREQIYRFEDILKLTTPEAFEILRTVPVKRLALSMRALGDELTAHIRSSLPKTLLAELDQEISSQGPQSLSQIRAAQAAIASLVQRALEKKK